MHDLPRIKCSYVVVQCCISNHSNQAIVCEDQSQVTCNDTVIKSSGGRGIDVTGGSRLVLRDCSLDLAQGPPLSVDDESFASCEGCCCNDFGKPLPNGFKKFKPS